MAGVLLFALLRRYVPAKVITTLFRGDEALDVLMTATIGVPLYACGGGTIPLLQAWLVDGMSIGSAALLMLAGPATQITNLGALKIVLGPHRFLLYIGFLSYLFLGARAGCQPDYVKEQQRCYRSCCVCNLTVKHHAREQRCE
nr:permease [Bifidobacterium pullorum]